VIINSSSPLLTVDDLTVEFGSSRVVENLNFSIAPGQTLAIVGESGSGKSITSLSIMRLADMLGARFPTGRILFNKAGVQTDLLDLPQKQMRRIRGKEISMIFQEPMTSLNPVFTIGDQVPFRRQVAGKGDPRRSRATERRQAACQSAWLSLA
jgi:glutathione transport system ATP-binding protein